MRERPQTFDGRGTSPPPVHDPHGTHKKVRVVWSQRDRLLQEHRSTFRLACRTQSHGQIVVTDRGCTWKRNGTGQRRYRSRRLVLGKGIRPLMVPVHVLSRGKLRCLSELDPGLLEAAGMMQHKTVTVVQRRIVREPGSQISEDLDGFVVQATCTRGNRKVLARHVVAGHDLRGFDKDTTCFFPSALAIQVAAIRIQRSAATGTLVLTGFDDHLWFSSSWSSSHPNLPLPLRHASGESALVSEPPSGPDCDSRPPCSSLLV